MRRLSFVICTVVFLSACGHKKIQVKTPQRPSVSSDDLEGLASYYAEPYHGRKTASGEIFDTYQALTAAHRTLPFNTLVRVTNKSNGREVDVRINDRGPFIDGRVIDLSLRAAREIDLVRPGIAPVKLKVLRAGEVAKTPVLPAPTAAAARTAGATAAPLAAPSAASLPATTAPPAALPVTTASATTTPAAAGPAATTAPATTAPAAALPVTTASAPTTPAAAVPATTITETTAIETTAPATAVPAPAGPAFAVQVGAFGSEQAAEDLKRRLEEKYPNVSVQMVTGDKTLYRVRVGGEPDRQAAEKLASELRKDDFQPFVVRLN